VIHPHPPPPGCRIPLGAGRCLEACESADRCRAVNLLLVDGRNLVGRAVGVVGETLRFEAVFPTRGLLLLPWREVEPLSLHEALGDYLDGSRGEDYLHLADMCSSRGLVDMALRELDRAVAVDPSLDGEAGERRARLHESAAARMVEDAREHLAAGRGAHALAALEEVLRRFPDTGSAEAGRDLRRRIAGEGPDEARLPAPGGRSSPLPR